MKKSATLLVVLGLSSTMGWWAWRALQPETREIPQQSKSDAPPKVPLATLESFLPKVTHKRSEAQVWEDSTAGIPLYYLDAVQTHDSAAAKIVFVEGARLELRERTHIIITSPPVSPPAPIQRTIVKNGRLKGRTGRALWLISSNTLLQLEAKAKGTEAIADYYLREDRKLTVTLESGLGTVFQKGADAAAVTRKYPLAEGKPLELIVATGPDETDWTENELANAEVVSARTQAAIPPFDFSVDLPVDNSTVNLSSLRVRGKVTKTGARLIVNGKEIPIETSLAFETEVKLVRGANRVVVQLIPPDGKPIYRQWVYIRRR